MFRAWVPADVDLEDRVLYGLTPQRLAIVAGAVLVAAALARHGIAGWILAAPVAAAGAACAWLKPLGRSPDAWALVAVRYLLRNRRLECDPARLGGPWRLACALRERGISRWRSVRSAPSIRARRWPPAALGIARRSDDGLAAGASAGANLRLIEGGRR